VSTKVLVFETCAGQFAKLFLMQCWLVVRGVEAGEVGGVFRAGAIFSVRENCILQIGLHLLSLLLACMYSWHSDFETWTKELR
jgi:hypothetical protein